MDFKKGQNIFTRVYSPQKRIDRLKAAIEDAKKDFITVVNDVDGWYE